MPQSRIPSPARSQGAAPSPRRVSLRKTRSVSSPARSKASGRLSSVIRLQDMDSFRLSPMPTRRSVLNDDTDIAEVTRRRSWWRKLSNNSRDVMELLNDNKIVETNEAIEEFIDIEVLSQEKKNFTMDIPESSDSESISSIVIPQRKLFSEKENKPQKNFRHLVGTRRSSSKLQKTTDYDKTLNIAPKNLFNQPSKAKSKPVFPAELLTISPEKMVNKTKEIAAGEVKVQVRPLFGNRPGTKRKNMFTDFIVSESEDEISEIQPRIFGFQNKAEQQREASFVRRDPSPTSSITTDVEMDEWKHLPSSTMVDNQLEDMIIDKTPIKKARLSKTSSTKINKSIQSNKDKSFNSSKIDTRSQSKNKIDIENLTKENLTEAENVENQEQLYDKVEEIDEDVAMNIEENKAEHKLQAGGNKKEMQNEIVNIKINSIINSPKSVSSNISINKTKVPDKSKLQNKSETYHSITEPNTSQTKTNSIINKTKNLEKSKASNKSPNLLSTSNQSLKAIIDKKNVPEQQLQESQRHDSDMSESKIDNDINQEVIEGDNEDMSLSLHYESEENNEDEKEKNKVTLKNSVLNDETLNKNKQDNNDSRTRNVIQNKIDSEKVLVEENKNEDRLNSKLGESKLGEEIKVAEYGQNSNEEFNQLTYRDANKSHAEHKTTGVEPEQIDEEQDKNNEEERQEQSRVEHKTSHKEQKQSEEKQKIQERSHVEHKISQKEKAQSEEEQEKSEEQAQTEEEQKHVEEDLEQREVEIDQIEDGPEQNEGEQEQVEERPEQSMKDQEQSEIEDVQNEVEQQNEDEPEQIEVEQEQNEDEPEQSEEEQEPSEVEEGQSHEEQEASELEQEQSDEELEASEVEHEQNQDEHERSHEGQEASELEQEQSDEELEASEVEHEQNQDEHERSHEEQEASEVEHEQNEEEQEQSEYEQEASEVEQEQSEEEQEASEVEQEQSEEEQEASEVEQDENEDKQEQSEGQEDRECSQSELEESQEVNPAEISAEINDSNENNEQTDDVDMENNDIEKESENTGSPNVSHDTTGRHRNKENSKMKSPEAVLHDKTKQMESFMPKGRNTSLRRTSILKSMNIRTTLAPPRESTGLSDGTRNSSAEGSGWDSHRTTRKTLRQTFGKDFSPRKSLRALVMEKSAKRQTAITDLTSVTSKFPLANSTELPEASNVDENVNPAESNNDVSKRTRQTTLQMYLQKIKKQNLEKKAKMEEAIRNSFKAPPKDSDIFKVPTRPPFAARKQSAKSQAKPKAKPSRSNLICFDDLPAEVKEDMKYKPPKRFQPNDAAWITKRLYKSLEAKLEPKYDYKARVRAEKLVQTIYNFARDLKRREVAPPDAVDVLKHEMARLDIVNTHHEFYQFFREYMPREIRIKVIPDILNKIPRPRQGMFSNILRENTDH